MENKLASLLVVSSGIGVARIFNWGGPKLKNLTQQATAETDPENCGRGMQI